MKTVLELKNVSKIYRLGDVEVPAVNGIDIKINQHDFVAIVGSSGSGKSTTLNIMSALDNVSKGQVFFLCNEKKKWRGERKQP